MVYSNAGPGGADALTTWYREMHAPDAFEGGMFHALHRYRSLGDYDAQFLAVWEGDSGSLDEIRDRMGLRRGAVRDRSRITSALVVVWSGFHFLAGQPSQPDQPGQTGQPDQPDQPADDTVRTMTLVEAPRHDLQEVADLAGAVAPTYDYGDAVLLEHREPPAEVRAAWAGRGTEGIAPHGPYRNIFDHPDAWPPVAETPTTRWISHWEPLSSQRRGTDGLEQQ
jgi:hypothetical protein